MGDREHVASLQSTTQSMQGEAVGGAAFDM